MWIANNWKEYEVLDCSSGEKLENWGGYSLIRPDPQVIWDTEKTLKEWKRPSAHYHRTVEVENGSFLTSLNSGIFITET